MINIFVFFFYILRFILLEIKIFVNSFFYLIKLIRSYNFFGNLLFNKKINFKNNDINKFLKKNSLVTNKEKLKINRNKILVELLLSHHLEPVILNCLIAKDFQKLYGAEIVGLINRNDVLTKKLAESFGINNFVFLNQNNFLKKFYYFVLSLNLINIDEIENKLKKLKFYGHEVGKASLENYLRWYNKNPQKKNKFYLYLFLSRAISSIIENNKLFKESYKVFLIGEIQFVPNKLLFHSSLKSRTPVYSYFGSSSIGFIGRYYKNYKDRNSVQLKFSKKFSNLLIKIFKKKNLLNMIKKKDGIKNIGKEIVWSDTKNTKTIKFKSKKDFVKYFGFETKKKIVLILPHAMSDNLFNNEWNLFDTAYDWYYKTLKKIDNINDVNWLIKPHPYEYKFPGITARSIFEKLKINKNNIKFLNENLHVDKIYKFINVVITGNGSAGYQYTSLGIPTITTSDSKYSNFNFTIAPKNQKEYFNLIKTINKIPKPNKEKIKKAQIYWLSNIEILYNSHGLLPKIKQHGFFKKQLFFKKISHQKIVRYKTNSFSEDIFTQIINKNRHSINTTFYNKYRKKYNFKLNDI